MNPAMVKEFLGRGYMARAFGLQLAVRAAEEGDDMEYDEAKIGRSVVHLREDMVTVISLLDSANQQLRTMRRLLWVLAAIAGFIGYRFAGG